VSKDFLNQFTDHSMVYGLFDENALRILDMIRDWAGVSLIVNNWHWNGQRKDCGFRTTTSNTGATKSAHKLGKAFDIVSSKITTVELWKLIDKNADKLPCKIRIERTCAGKQLTWLHFDTNATIGQKDKILYFDA
jgi:hypothetical protein